MANTAWKAAYSKARRIVNRGEVIKLTTEVERQAVVVACIEWQEKQDFLAEVYAMSHWDEVNEPEGY